jgi:riboflavin transporter FmnP
MSKKFNTRKIAIMGLFTALAYVSLFFVRIPVMPTAQFLRYDVKDIIITLGGFLFGPLECFIIAFAVGFIQMFSLSDTGIIGMIMNVISTAAFACTATYIYKRKESTVSAVVGLLVGCAVMVVFMLFMNYAVTPIYMGIDREVVKSMLLPVFLPFNTIKGVLNAVGTMALHCTVGKRIKKVIKV